MTEQEKYKLIERSCKYDAYSQIYLWGKTLPRTEFETDHDQTVWHARQKMKMHKEWLSQQEFRYDFVNGFIPNDGYYESGE